jgi:hypothetical protein
MDAEPTGFVQDDPAAAELDQDVDAATEGTPSTSLRETGDPTVDRVIASLSALDTLPVSEHAAVYEAAHDTLRQALAGRSDTSEGA